MRLTAATARGFVLRQVLGDGEKPGRKPRITPKAPQLLEHLDKRLLRQIFGLLQGTGHTICQRVDHVLITLDQLFKCLMIALAA